MENEKGKGRQGERDANLDEEMERETQIRRDTQVRGSLGLPPSGEESATPRREEDAVPEFERSEDEERGNAS